MGRRFVIGDHHFGHANIIQYESRPFKDVREMDAHMIQCWNGAVCSDDTVFVLGDFTFYPKDVTTKIMQQLRGRKILILGNHDTRSRKFYLDAGFEQVIPYPIIVDGFWILSHEEVYLNVGMPYVNIHAHRHSKSVVGANYFCASVEQPAINYTPKLLDDIKKLYSAEDSESEMPTLPVHGGA